LERLPEILVDIVSIAPIDLVEVGIMAKDGIHPEWYPEAKVYCNGELVMTVGSTQPELHVDIWAGNHPFFTGTQRMLDTEGRVERFLRKYGMATDSDKK
jgi:large subunit ribosomal protein L31